MKRSGEGGRFRAYPRVRSFSLIGMTTIQRRPRRKGDPRPSPLPDRQKSDSEGAVGDQHREAQLPRRLELLDLDPARSPRRHAHVADSRASSASTAIAKRLGTGAPARPSYVRHVASSRERMRGPLTPDTLRSHCMRAPSPLVAGLRSRDAAVPARLPLVADHAALRRRDALPAGSVARSARRRKSTTRRRRRASGPSSIVTRGSRPAPSGVVDPSRCVACRGAADFFRGFSSDPRMGAGPAGAPSWSGLEARLGSDERDLEPRGGTDDLRHRRRCAEGSMRTMQAHDAPDGGRECDRRGRRPPSRRMGSPWRGGVLSSVLRAGPSPSS